MRLCSFPVNRRTINVVMMMMMIMMQVSEKYVHLVTSINNADTLITLIFLNRLGTASS